MVNYPVSPPLFCAQFLRASPDVPPGKADSVSLETHTITAEKIPLRRRIFISLIRQFLSPQRQNRANETRHTPKSGIMSRLTPFPSAHEPARSRQPHLAQRQHPVATPLPSAHCRRRHHPPYRRERQR